MNENSPICARLRPTRLDRRKGDLKKRTATAIRSSAFTNSMEAAKRNTWGRCAVRYLNSRSIPIEIKKRELKVSLKGRISATIWFEYSDSDIASPAMNAPRARERPLKEVAHAVPRHTNTIVSMNT